jgi:ribonucleoside-triphosphate reductase (formate)
MNAIEPVEIRKKCAKKIEVYSRIVGYFRPVENWNVGKREEFKDRKVYVTAGV